MTINFTTTDETFSIIVNGTNKGTWTRTDEIDSDFGFSIYDTLFIFSLTNPYINYLVSSSDTIQIDGVTQVGTIREIVADLKDDVFFLPAASSSGGTATLQGVIDNGSTLDKDNTIDGGGHVLVISKASEVVVQASDSDESNGAGLDSYPNRAQLYAYDADGNQIVLKATPTGLTKRINNGPEIPIATVNYKVYTALLSNAGDGQNIVPDELENTIGGTWTYDTDGSYILDTDVDFAGAKIYIPNYSDGNNGNRTPFFNNSSNEIIGSFNIISENNAGKIRFYLDVTAVNGSNVSLYTFISTNKWAMPEIRIKPAS